MTKTDIHVPDHGGHMTDYKALREAAARLDARGVGCCDLIEEKVPTCEYRVWAVQIGPRHYMLDENGRNAGIIPLGDLPPTETKTPYIGEATAAAIRALKVKP